MRLQKAQEQQHADGNKKKRKAAADDDDGDSTLRKKSKPANGLPEGFFDGGAESEAAPEAELEASSPPKTTNGVQIPSRPATPAKAAPPPPQPLRGITPAINEDEWAAFEADIAEAPPPETAATIISAPAMSAAEVKAKSVEETNAQRKERLEAEMEGDREDAARKLEDEFEEMEGLEERVRRMREKREAVKVREVRAAAVKSMDVVEVEDDDEEDDDDEDDWDGFRMKR